MTERQKQSVFILRIIGVAVFLNRLNYFYSYAHRAFVEARPAYLKTLDMFDYLPVLLQLIPPIFLIYFIVKLATPIGKWIGKEEAITKVDE